MIQDFYDRFWEKVIILGQDVCWPWIGQQDDDGYGKFRLGPRQHGRSNRIVLWLSLGKPIPKGMQALHTCDNPPCCNPEHIYAGTPRQNMMDMVKRRRKPDLVTTYETAVEIRRLYASTKHVCQMDPARYTLKRLASMFGIKQATVEIIIRGNVWKDEDYAT